MEAQKIRYVSGGCVPSPEKPVEVVEAKDVSGGIPSPKKPVEVVTKDVSGGKVSQAQIPTVNDDIITRISSYVNRLNRCISLLSEYNKFSKYTTISDSFTQLENSIQELSGSIELIESIATNLIPVYQIIVLCSAKSGSSTLWRTLLNHGFTSLHTHGNEEYKICQNGVGHLLDDVVPLSARAHEKVYIIDSYRTPIERKMSSFFHIHISRVAPNYNDMTIPELIEIFNSTCLFRIEEYQSHNEAFDHYGLPRWESFDFSRGYNIREVDGKIFIKLRLADSKHWSTILSELLDRKISVTDYNIGEEHQYAAKYKEFKKAYRVPRAYLETLKTDVEFNIYTTRAEREAYFEKWYAQSVE